MMKLVTIKTFLLLFLLIIWLPNISFPEVIFEDDFDGFSSGWLPSDMGTGHHVTGGTAESPGKGEPYGWTGWVDHHSDNFIGIVTGEGRDGTPCLKIGAEPAHSPYEQVGLIKYLGPTGYSELYIRYYVKYDDNWRWGDGTNGSQYYHKWLRIWQDVQVDEVLGYTGNLSDEHNRGFLLITTMDDDYGSFDPFFMGTFSQDTASNSVEPPYTSMWSYRWVDSDTGGFVENHFGNIEPNGNWSTTQTWHSVEVHLKLATSLESGDGIFEMWIDGIKQDHPTETAHRDRGVLEHDEMPTPQYGTGMNYIGLHDNGTGNQLWPDYRYVWIDDFIVSTESIGPPVDCSAFDPVRIPGVTDEYFTNFQDAYDLVNDLGVIQSQDGILNESIDINLNKRVTIEGGYNCNYTIIEGETVLQGNLIISAGELIVDDGIFRIE